MKTRSWLLLCLLILPLVAARTPTYYADVQFAVQTDGAVVTSGTTNYPEFTVGSTQNYTTKTRDHWLLNITTQDQFAEYVYSITLPSGAIVNYVHGTNAQITTEGSRVVVKGSGSNGTMSAVVQYTVVDSKENSWWIAVPVIIIAALLLALIGIAKVQRKQKREHRIYKEEHSEKNRDNTPAMRYIDGLPERQQQIIAFLRKADGTLTQRQIELAMKIPKSSVSRNVDALRKRGILEKAQMGMTNTVVLADKYC